MDFFSAKKPEVSKAEVAELSKRKDSLLLEISRLGIEEERLNAVVANHEGDKADLSKVKEDLASASLEVAGMYTVKSNLEKEIVSLNERVFVLRAEEQKLMSSVSEKKGYISDIEKYKSALKSAHEDSLRAEQDSFDRKSKAQEGLDGIRSKVSELHAMVGNVLEAAK